MRDCKVEKVSGGAVVLEAIPERERTYFDRLEKTFSLACHGEH